MPTYKYTWFSGLLNMGVWDFSKPANELSACKNIQEDEVGVLKRVPWSSKASTDKVNSATSMVWFLSYYFQNSTWNSYLIAWSESWTWYNLEYRTTAEVPENAPWTPLTWWTYALRANAKLSSVNYLDRLFIVWHDATDNAFINPATIFWTTHTISAWTDANLLNMPYWKYIVEFQDLLYVLNTSIWWIKYPSHAYYCNDPIDGAITWNNTLNFLEFGQQDWEEITWWAKSNDRLVVFKSNSMWTWDESNKRRIASIWCDSHESIKEVNWILYWFNRNGIWRWDGAIPQLISWKVQPFIEAIDQTQLNRTIAVINWYEYRLFIGNVSVRWITYTNCWIVFDVRREKFYIRCTANPALSATEYIEAWKKRSYFWSDTGYVYKFSQYIDSINSDDWAEIDHFFITNTIDFWDPAVVKLIWETHFYTLNSNWLKYVIDADKSWEFNEWVPGQISWWNVYSDIVWASWHRFTFKFFWKDSWTPMEFEWMVLDVNVKEE